MNNLVLNGHTEHYKHHNGKHGVCVQIGLHDTAEFLYLTKPNWKSDIVSQDILKQIPNDIADKYTTWRYYGIDSDVGSIAKMLQKYGNPPSTHWVHAAVGMPSDMYMKLRSYLPNGYFYGFGCSLQRLFRMLNITQVDVLVIDIEGGEIRLFDDYDWHIFPSYISVEVHGDHANTSVPNPTLLNKHIAYVDNILKTKGYKQINRTLTNCNTLGYATCELQYRR